MLTASQKKAHMTTVITTISTITGLRGCQIKYLLIIHHVPPLKFKTLKSHSVPRFKQPKWNIAMILRGVWIYLAFLEGMEGVKGWMSAAQNSHKVWTRLKFYKQLSWNMKTPSQMGLRRTLMQCCSGMLVLNRDSVIKGNRPILISKLILPKPCSNFRGKLNTW